MNAPVNDLNGLLRLNAADVHDVAVDDRRVLFHVPTMALFDLDDVSGAVLDLFKEMPEVAPADVSKRFGERFDAAEVTETIGGFVDLGIVQGVGEAMAPGKLPSIENFPLSTIILNVNTGCNLSCTYCYKEDLTTPAKGNRMDFETARASVDLLIEQSEGRDRVNIVFFGGEPLSRLKLIKEVVAYAEEACAAAGKKTDFSLTTNGTLLTEAVIDWLDEHRFGIAISMDGPKAIHDQNRLTVGGKGTYDVVAKKAKMLLSRYRSRPVGTRVTLTSGITDVIGIHDHLKNDLGFFEVGFAPATAGDDDSFNLSAEELAEVFENMKALGRQYVEGALAGHNNGFANMHQMMTDLHEGARKALPCGAGIGLLAVDGDGGLNLCHRFTGSDLPTFGTIEDGIDKAALGSFLEDALDKDARGCGTCRIRSLCAGGCYHESYARYGDPHNPVWHYCDLLRDWVDFGIEAYATILARNPAFFRDHVLPRSSGTRTMWDGTLATDSPPTSPAQ